VRIEKEYIDDRRFYPIITDLRRRALPIVNYKLNDILVERKTPCPCGSRFLAIDKIEGRQDDVFEFGGVAVFPDFIRRCMMFVENINEYRVQQSAADEITIFMDIEGEATKEKIRAEFEELARDFAFPAPRLKFEAYEFDISKKLKRVEKLC
jgi:putative adenylate-forming enzyme